MVHDSSTINVPSLPENRKAGLDVIQINPLSRNNFGQYQASLAAQDTGIKYRIQV